MQKLKNEALPKITGSCIKKSVYSTKFKNFGESLIHKGCWP